MSTEKQFDLKAALEQIEAEWKAFQIVHKMRPKPFAVRKDNNYPVVATIHSLSYGQGKLWSQSEQIADSQRLNEIDRLKG